MLKDLNWSFFLQVKKPTKERIKKAQTWLNEIIRRLGVIWGCTLESLYKNQPKILPGYKYKIIKMKLHK